MATLNVSFTFDADSESFTANTNQGVVAQWQSADGDPANGCLEGRITGKNQNVAGNDWTRQLTFEDMGVPAGATITAISAASMMTRCSEYNTGTGTNQSQGCLLTPSGQTAIEIAAASANFTGTTAWAQQTGAGATGLSLPSDTSCQLQWLFDLRTANSASAAVTIRGDTIAFTIEYDEDLAGPEVVFMGAGA